VLTNLLTTAGLAVEHSWTYCRRDLPRSMHLNGREGVGCIASSYTE
jgi:hypothetical protein